MDYMESFNNLNEYQREAVVSNERAALLNAAVGSGKTTVIIHKILYLHIVKKIPLSEIVVLTFTNKAAAEIRERLKEFIEVNEIDGRLIGTFHSVARSILATSDNLSKTGYSSDFNIIDSEESVTLLNEIIERENLNIKYKSKLQKRVEELKNGKCLFGVMKRDDDIKKLYDLYRDEKLNRNLMDFDDLIDEAINIMDEPLNPSWIIIDEFQDSDVRQLNMIRKMEGKDTHVFAVGDPYQTIYSWRTGTNNIFERFKEEYKPAEYSLPINYRSSRTIVEAASSFMGNTNIQGIKDYGNPILIKRNYDSFNEALYFARKINEVHEKEGIPYSEFAILYRRRQQGELINDVFKREGIPGSVVFKKVLPYEEDGADNGVSLLTLHASKGLEFSYVFIAGANMGNIPLSNRRGEEEEEARLFFVGITRAKSRLEISYLTKPDIPGVTKYPSPYISMLPSNLIVKDIEENNTNLKDLINAIRQERDSKKAEVGEKPFEHQKYGKGKIIFEDENIIRVEFEAYGEKEFLKAFL